MANNNIQKDAGVMEYVDSAARNGGRLLRDIYNDVLSPAGRNLENVVGKDVVHPAIRKIKEAVGPKWRELSRAGHSAKNYVLKGLTGISRLGGDAYNTARGLYNSSEEVGGDLLKAYGGVKGGLRDFVARYKDNSGATADEVGKLLNRHFDASSNNAKELGSDIKGVLGDAWKSISNRIHGGMNKSSSMQKDALFGFLGRMTARRVMANARKILPTARAARNRAYSKATNPGKTVNGTHEGIPDMSYKGPTNANFGGTVPNTTMSTPPAVPQPSPTPKANPGRGGRSRGRRRGGYGAGSNIVNNIHVGNGASPAIATAGQAPKGSAANWVNTAMNGLVLGGMGYNMVGGGGAAAAAAPAEAAQLAAANPGMYMPQTNYVNWAAGNNVLKGLYM